MATTGTAALSEVVSSLFTEPLQGFNKAQIDIVDHWLAALNALASNGGGGAADPGLYAQAIAMAPK